MKRFMEELKSPRTKRFVEEKKESFLLSVKGVVSARWSVTSVRSKLFVYCALHYIFQAINTD